MYLKGGCLCSVIDTENYYRTYTIQFICQLGTLWIVPYVELTQERIYNGNHKFILMLLRNYIVMN